MPELPFARFPGATLARVYGPDTESDLLRRTRVSRDYVVSGKSLHEIFEHYRSALKEHGISLESRPTTGAAISVFLDKPHREFEGSISVSNAPIVPLPGIPLRVEDYQRMMPGVVDDFPADVICFRVSVNFVDNEMATKYWSVENRRESHHAQEIFR